MRQDWLTVASPQLQVKTWSALVHTVPLKSKLPVASMGHRSLRESCPTLQESRSARRKPRSRRRDSRLARGW